MFFEHFLKIKILFNANFVHKIYNFSKKNLIVVHNLKSEQSNKNA